jgi:hypothetical protein
VKRALFLLQGLLLGLSGLIADSIDVDKLADLVGYTVLAATNVKGSFEGADYDKLVGLDNGWIFEFKTYHYHYAYHPVAIVFAKRTTAQELRALGLKSVPEDGIITYKLIIEDEVYDVSRVK